MNIIFLNKGARARKKAKKQHMNHYMKPNPTKYVSQNCRVMLERHVCSKI